MKPAAALLAAALLALALPAPAGAAGGTPGSTSADPNALTPPARLDVAPPGRRLSGDRAYAIARRVPKVRRALAHHPRATHGVYQKGADRWQVSWFDRRGREVAQVLIDDRSGAVLEQWTGFQVAWTMARGYPGAFGRSVNAPYVWIPLCLLFLAPFVDPRRPFRLLHLDLLVLLGFSISLAFFNHGEIGVSVPLVYPFLVYLLARMLVLGRSRARDRRGEPLRLLVPRAWVAVGIVFLLAFRIALNVTDSNVIDVGYAGVIGAHQLVEGQPLYGHFPADNRHGDTYGPVNYLAYVPFVTALGWSGRWDDLPAAHAAAVAFDVLALLALFLLGRRVRGPTLGLALAYAWAAYPFTLYVSSTNAGDGLVALLVVLAYLAASSPVRRGALTALAGLTKFAPLALAPLLATYHGPVHALDGEPRGAVRLRAAVPFTLALAAVAALAAIPVFLHGGDVGTFWQRTIGFQAGRGAPFSLYGLYGWPHAVQLAVQVAAVVMALALALVPRRRDVVQLAALGAAVLIALQLGLTYWFYLYIAWFFPLVMLALLGSFREPARRSP